MHVTPLSAILKRALPVLWLILLAAAGSAPLLAQGTSRIGRLNAQVKLPLPRTPFGATTVRVADNPPAGPGKHYSGAIV